MRIRVRFQVTRIVSFLPERGLRFRNLPVFFFLRDLQCTCTDLPGGTPFVQPFPEGCGAFIWDQDPAPTVRIRDLNRRFDGLVPSRTCLLRKTQFLFLVSGLHFADDAEAPMAVARDVDAISDGSPFGDRRGPLRATRAGSLEEGN